MTALQTDRMDSGYGHPQGRRIYAADNRPYLERDFLSSVCVPNAITLDPDIAGDVLLSRPKCPGWSRRVHSSEPLARVSVPIPDGECIAVVLAGEGCVVTTTDGMEGYGHACAKLSSMSAAICAKGFNVAKHDNGYLNASESFVSLVKVGLPDHDHVHCSGQ